MRHFVIAATIVASAGHVSAPAFADDKTAGTAGAIFGQVLFVRKMCPHLQETREATKMRSEFKSAEELRAFDKQATLVAMLMASCTFYPTAEKCAAKLRGECVSALEELGPKGTRKAGILVEKR